MNLLDLLTLKGKKSKIKENDNLQPGHSIENVFGIINEFPVGAPIGYYPEFKKDIKLDSLLVGYMINNHGIYSHNDISFAKTATGPVLNLVTPDAKISIKNIDSFHILLPLITRTTIDYTTKKSWNVDDQKSSEKKINDFMRGSTITLFARTPNVRGIYHIDTVVSKNIVLKDGHYANSKLVLLEPQIDTFECMNLRRMQRVNTEIPAEIQLPKEKKRHPCLIRDFSEKFIRIELLDTKEIHHGVAVNRNIFLIIMPNDPDKQMIINGVVHRNRNNNVIISMNSLFKKGLFQKLDQLDEFVIKATLLNHPQTKRS